MPNFYKRNHMDQLIPITGYANSYQELCNKTAEPGEFYNVLDEKPFVTYCKEDSTEIGDTLMETDVIGWYKNKAELESNERVIEGEVFITGDASPFTRWKGAYVDRIATWVEDGQEEKKIVRKFKNQAMLTRSRVQPEEGVFYAVGSEAPYKVYGVVSAWTPVGSFISYIANSMTQLVNKPTKSSPGEVAYMNGLYYIYDGTGWNEIIVEEPIESVYKHTYAKNGVRYRLREGFKFGTLEFFAPRKL